MYQLAIDNLVEKAKQNGFNKIRMNLLGGEVSAYKDFKKLLSYINDIKDIEFVITIFTNLSASEKYWKEIFHLKNIEFKMIASYHDEYSNLDTFLSKVLVLKSYTPIMIDVVVAPNNFDHLVKVCEKIKSVHEDYIFEFQCDTNENINPEYTLEMIETINSLNLGNSKFELIVETESNIFSYKNPLALLSAGYINYKGWNCDAGFNSIIIDKDFNVRRCWSGIDKYLGNLKSDFNFIKKKCISTSCVCTADLRMRKQKDGD
jgi:MoaA/NifB/PqqE/SkfB family radical SAM enzyme